MPKDPIKAMKKAARDIELEMGVRFTYNRPHKSKKVYNRKDKSWKKDSGPCYFFIPEKPLYTKVLESRRKDLLVKVDFR